MKTDRNTDAKADRITEAKASTNADAMTDAKASTNADTKVSTKARVILVLNAILTKAVYMLYPLLLVYLAIYHLTDKEPGFVPALLVPGISFVLLSIFRSRLNWPRPYEMPGAEPPIIKKDAPGKSFPSRHIFSIFVIAVTVFWVWPVPGIIIGIAGAVLAWCRVAGGVHFPRDVIAGAAIGIGCGIIGFYVILPLL